MRLDDEFKQTYRCKQIGFSLTRETPRFEWKETQTQRALSERLIFPTLDDVGEDRFVSAIMRVSEKTLDRTLQQEQEKLGSQYAWKKFKGLKAFKYKSNSWQLAYTQNGSLVGLIMPVENDGKSIIGYIGVIPEYRGQNYVNDLLAQETLTLKTDGAISIRADADINNAPMVSAFKRAGYKQFASRREYHLMQLFIKS